MSSRARSSPPFWLLHAGGWGGVFAVGYLSLLSNSKPAGFGRVWLAVVATGCLGTLGLRYLLRSLTGAPPLRLAAWLAAPALGISAAMAATYESFARLQWCDGCLPFSPLGFAAYTAVQMYVVVGWCSLYLVISTTRALQRQSEALLAATATAHHAHLKMLRYQLTPHFLFNTLNAVSTLLLDRDTTTANRMVHGLGAFLRYTLDADPMQRVTLRQEIDAVNLYLDIERLRFSDRLRTTADIDAACWPARVPSLLLQPLIENAVKFGVARSPAGATIDVRARREDDALFLSVTDDGPGAGTASRDEGGDPARRGVGLSNTRDRLRALYGDRQSVRIVAGPSAGFSVELRLPFDTTAGSAA